MGGGEKEGALPSLEQINREENISSFSSKPFATLPQVSRRLAISLLFHRRNAEPTSLRRHPPTMRLLHSAKHATLLTSLRTSKAKRGWTAFFFPDSPAQTPRNIKRKLLIISRTFLRNLFSPFSRHSLARHST